MFTIISSFHINYLIWKFILVRSSGAIVVLANPPAIAPAQRLVSTISILLKLAALLSEGAFFASEDAIMEDCDHFMVLFSKKTTAGINLWRYLGETVIW